MTPTPLKHSAIGNDMTATESETMKLEVYCYTWPLWYLSFFWSFMVATFMFIMIVMVDQFRDALADWTIPLATASGIYVIFFGVISRSLKLDDKIKQARSRPSLVADQAGITTKWSKRVPWNDVRDFTVGIARTNRGGELMYPSVVVSDVSNYRRPWYLYGVITKWKPENALPILPTSTYGYVMRSNDLNSRKQVSSHKVIEALRKFHEQISASKFID